MKNQRLFLLLISFCCWSIATANAQSIYKQNSIKYTGFSQDQTYHLHNKKTNPACHVKIDFFYPDLYADAVVLKKVQGIFISSFFGGKYENLSPDKRLKSYINNYIDEYKTQFEHNDLYESEWAKSDDLYSFEKIMRNTILLNKGNVVSQVINTYEYRGGAHGTSEKQGMVIDLNTGKKLQWGDIFKKDSYMEMKRLLLANLLKSGSYEDKDALMDAGFDFTEIPFTDNFVADEKGIIFIYNPYEIGASFLGIIEIVLPYSELVFYMKEEGALYRWAKNYIPGNWVKYETQVLRKEYLPYHYDGFSGFTADIQFTFPGAILRDSNFLPEVQREFIKNAFGEEYSALSPEKAMETFFQDTLADYKTYMNAPNTMTYINELIEGVPAKKKGLALATFSKNLSQQNVFHYNSNGLISYVVKTTHYNGGMSDLQIERAFTVDITSGKSLGLKEVFEENRREDLNSLIINHLLKEKGTVSIENLEAKGYYTNKIVATDNFFFNDKGITFLFQPNEIALSSSGIQSIFVSYEEIAHYMREELLKRLNINNIKF